MRLVLALALALAPALAAAGCATITMDPESSARAALDELASAIATGEGSLSKLEGTMSGGGYSVPFMLEIARDGTRHFALSAGGLAIDVYCKDEKVVRMIGEVPYAARGGCPLDGGAYGSPVDAIDGLELASTHREGVFLVADFVTPMDPEDLAEMQDEGFGSASNLTLTIDGRGNARRIQMSAPGPSGMDANASHEPRKRWSLPETEQRLAAAIEGDQDFNDGRYEWDVDDAYDNVSLDEIEVRVNKSGERVATFRPSGGEQNQSGLLFRFEDADGDGRLSESDGFTIENASWANERDYEVVVWDTWADAPLAGRRIPESPFVLALALALALALVQRVSRHRG